MPLVICRISLKKPFPKNLCWGHKQRHTGQIQFGAHRYCPGDGEKENGLLDSKCCSSSKAHGQPNAEDTFCSSSASMNIWRYIAQKLHLLYIECNGMVMHGDFPECFHKNRSQLYQGTRRKKHDPGIQPSCERHQS